MAISAPSYRPSWSGLVLAFVLGALAHRVRIAPLVGTCSPSS